MKTYLMAGAAALALTLAACGGGSGNNAGAPGGGVTETGELRQIPAPDNGDWTQVIAETERGFRMGNPEAPVKLVEYASITCPACGAFSESAKEPIQSYIRSGQVSWEYRPFMLFPTDPGLFALLRCQGAGSYFQLLEQLYAEQQAWTLRTQQFMQQNEASLGTMSVTDRAAALVRGGGLDQFFRQRGMPQGRIDACLADPRNLQRVADDTEAGSREDDVSGTPTFLINGAKVQAILWNQLEPQLRQRIGG